MNAKHGFLADYFEGFGYKTLKPVEIDPDVSHEHEFNGINQFKELFGTDKQHLPCRVIYLSDDEEEIIEDSVTLTWYDAREKNPDRAAEYRLYYSESDCFAKANSGDLMVVCRNKADISATMFISRNGDTVSNQLEWLFGISDGSVTTVGKAKTLERDISLDYVSDLILEKAGIALEQPDDSALDVLLEKFPDGFPKTVEFSDFARSMVEDVTLDDGVDNALIEWLDYEEYIFRVYEKYIVGGKLQSSFDDVNDFISFSLSVQNRRKSRAGYALENHLKYVFESLEIKYSYNKATEGNAKPDFIFPGIKEYHNDSFSPVFLTMLGVKTTCKDRWRQVLSEAERIQKKHLFTLEPRISQSQTDEMIGHKLQLVVPEKIKITFNQEQQKWLLTLADFTELVEERQKKSIANQ